MGVFFKRDLSDKSKAIVDLLSTADTNAVLSFDGETALNQSDIFTAVKIIASDLAASRFVYQREQPLKNDLTLDMLNQQPNETMSSYVFWFAIVVQMMLSGNSFAIIERDAEEFPVALRYAKPSQMVIYENQENETLSYDYTDLSGKSYRLAASEVLHFKPFTTNGKTGISPIYALKTELSMLKNGNSLLASFFNKGVQSGGVLTLTKSNVNNTAKKQIKKDFEEVNSGASNANSIIVLDSNEKYEQFELNTDILKMIQNNVYSTKQIAKTFGIPLSRFGMELVNTTDDSANDVYISSTLHSYDRVICDELFVKLDVPLEKDFSSLIGRDPQSTIYKLIEDGGEPLKALTINEVRAFLGYSDVDKGERLFGELTATRGGGTNGIGNTQPIRDSNNGT